VERIGCSSAVCGGIGQWIDYFHLLNDRPGPTVRDDERQRIVMFESVAQVETNGNLLYIPELLRVKGTILLLLPEHNRNDAEACFLQALELSRDQGARAWELRAAIDLARLLAARGAIDEAHELLRPVFEHFVEGLGTTDLRDAERLLATLR